MVPSFTRAAPTAWQPTGNPDVVPTPDPHEEFDHIAHQIFGSFSPAPGAPPNMGGFLADYALTDAGAATAAQIMQSFDPGSEQG